MYKNSYWFNTTQVIRKQNFWKKVVYRLQNNSSIDNVYLKYYFDIIKT